MSQISRRTFIVRALAIVGVSSVSGRFAFGGVVGLNAEILKIELRAKNELETAFIDDVVQKAQNGELPIKILQASYRYAVKKEKSRRMIYFARCLDILSKQAGLKIEFLTF